ncbi:MAG: biotin/lipoate A/B protein ligase family protein [Aerococcus sp.]|nr:biotin/lipoate A/B protein ligase family protein [Aerococcus sp.]
MLLEDYIDTNNDEYAFGVMTHFETTDTIQSTFAKDDTILHQMNTGEFPFPAALHFWPTDPVVFLGMQDTRLPYFEAGVDELEQSGYTPVVRPAGGLAVVGDPLVINFTLLFHATEQKPSINAAYQIIVDLLNALVKPYHEEFIAGEVETSYCPGKYDLSLHGKKIAGLAQRRVGDAIGLYVYLSLSGDQQKRGHLIRQFYQTGLQGEETKIHYPDVDPSSMANLSFTLPHLGTVENFSSALLATYQALDDVTLIPFQLTPEMMTPHLEAMKRRNERLSHE